VVSEDIEDIEDIATCNIFNIFNIFGNIILAFPYSLLISPSSLQRKPIVHLDQKDIVGKDIF
jgi:hypothetical protein